MEKFVSLIPDVNIIVFYEMIELLIKNNEMDTELSVILLKALTDKVNKVIIFFNCIILIIEHLFMLYAFINLIIK